MSLLIAVLLIAEPVQPAAQAPAAPAASANADPSRKICQSIAISGSRLRNRRICATKAEWDALERNSKEAADGALSRRAGPSPGQ